VDAWKRHGYRDWIREPANWRLLHLFVAVSLMREVKTMNITQLVIVILSLAICLAVGAFCIARPSAVQ